jgi:hypothetical protein
MRFVVVCGSNIAKKCTMYTLRKTGKKERAPCGALSYVDLKESLI